MSALILIARDGPVTTLTLNRPDKRNALNVPLLEQLGAAIQAAEDDATQRILVLRGAGTVFCAGIDLQEAEDPAVADVSTERLVHALRSLAMTRLVTIAAVQGAAVAGGAGLLSACDFAVATSDAKFGFPEVRRGIVPALIMTFLRRQLREREARELLLLGKFFHARHALGIGLINRTVADIVALDTEVRALVSSILQGAPATQAITKQMLAELWPVAIADDLERARTRHLAGRESTEAREGIAAFNAKRPPPWAPK